MTDTQQQNPDHEMETLIDNMTPESAGTLPKPSQEELIQFFEDVHTETVTDHSPMEMTIEVDAPPGYREEVEEMAATLRSRGKKIPPIEDIRIIMDGNMTLAVLNKDFIGWSKFNPNDKTTWLETSKRGRYHVRSKSKYSPKAGRMKAIRRALELMTIPHMKI